MVVARALDALVATALLRSLTHATLRLTLAALATAVFPLAIIVVCHCKLLRKVLQQIGVAPTDYGTCKYNTFRTNAQA